MTTYETTFSEQLGSTNEIIKVKLEYCQDFTGDGNNDIKVTLSLDPSSNSGTEDMLGVAFDIQNDAVSDLSIVQIQRSTSFGTLSTFNPTTFIGANQISDSPGFTDPGFNTSGGGSDEPYDVGIKFSDQGAAEGIVQSASFVITGGMIELDAEALLENTDWWVRLQSTDGGGGSAKMGGFIADLPECGGGGGGGETGIAQTPGFWKQPHHFQYWPDAYAPTDSFTGTFGVNVTLRTDNGDTLLGGLTARGGGVNALARAATAGLLNAASDATTGINYIIDPIALANSVVEVGGDLNTILSTLDTIDSSNDGRIGVGEIITAVQDAVGTIAGPLGINQVATALDAMNNYVHLDVSEFP